MHDPYQYNSYPPVPPNKSNNNAVIIAIIAVLGVLIVTLIIIGTLFLSGVLSADKNNEPEPTATVTATAEATAVPVNMYVANVKNSIYFRSAPAENSSNIICEIPVGTVISFIENADAVFAKIMYNGQTGYVKREYLSSAPPTAAPTSAGNTTVQYNMYVVNVKHSIYLRSTPSENGSIICEIPLGTEVGFIERANNTFTKINYNGKIGYSKSEYLSSSQPYVSSNAVYLTVCNVKHSIYLRSSPSESGGIICEIPVGSRVRYISTPNSTFTKIEWNGKTGYSKTEYLR